MKAVSLAPSQHELCVDADAWCKQAVTVPWFSRGRCVWRPPLAPLASLSWLSSGWPSAVDWWAMTSRRSVLLWSAGYNPPTETYSKKAVRILTQLSVILSVVTSLFLKKSRKRKKKRFSTLWTLWTANLYTTRFFNSFVPLFQSTCGLWSETREPEGGHDVFESTWERHQRAVIARDRLLWNSSSYLHLSCCTDLKTQLFLSLTVTTEKQKSTRSTFGKGAINFQKCFP